jgi:hypothetical protein
MSNKKGRCQRGSINPLALPLKILVEDLCRFQEATPSHMCTGCFPKVSGKPPCDVLMIVERRWTVVPSRYTRYSMLWEKG